MLKGRSCALVGLGDMNVSVSLVENEWLRKIKKPSRRQRFGDLGSWDLYMGTMAAWFFYN